MIVKKFQLSALFEYVYFFFQYIEITQFHFFYKCLIELE